MINLIGVEVIINELTNGAIVGASIYKVVKTIARKNDLDELKSLYKDRIVEESKKGD